jgi:hypothetical protein
MLKNTLGTLETWWKHFGKTKKKKVQKNQDRLKINFQTIPKNKLEPSLGLNSN